MDYLLNVALQMHPAYSDDKFDYKLVTSFKDGGFQGIASSHLVATAFFC